MSFSSSALYGCRSASEGSALTSSAQCRKTKSNCGGSGRSTHRVPSLSKAAIRSARSTNPGPCVVVAETMSRMACLAGPSFQLASGGSFMGSSFADWYGRWGKRALLILRGRTRRGIEFAGVDLVRQSLPRVTAAAIQEARAGRSRDRAAAFAAKNERTADRYHRTDDRTGDVDPIAGEVAADQSRAEGTGGVHRDAADRRRPEAGEGDVAADAEGGDRADVLSRRGGA